MSVEAIVLQDIVRTVSGPREEHSRRDSTGSLFSSRADGGKDAWLFLTGAFVIEGLTWGYAFSYGIFQDYYSNLPIFEEQKDLIAIIGTTSTGIMYLCSPVALPLLRSFPHRRRQGMMAGLAVLCISYIGASFARTVPQLIVTQGVLVGIGLSMTYYPVFSFLDEWFVYSNCRHLALIKSRFILRKGFAYGICWAASGLSGLILPYLFSWLLERYSFRTMLRIWAIINVLLIIPALTLIKPRVPYTPALRIRKPDLSFATDTSFLTFCAGNVLAGLGYFLPGIYLPSYTRSLGFSKAIATTSVSVLNIGTFLGFICGGIVADRWSSNSIVGYSTIGTTLTVVLIWGFSFNIALIFVFAFMYSFFGACFVTTWSGLTTDFVRKNTARGAEPGIIYSFFIAGRGIGNIISGPLSKALLEDSNVTSSFIYGYGSGYGSLIVFAAVTAALGGLGPVCKFVGLIT